MAKKLQQETREALLDAAEGLFASEGVDGVSLAAITQLAEQRNGGAIHYYFGGRDGLLAAILDRHEEALDEVRADALIQARAAGPMTLESLVRVGVESLASRLDSDSGRSFLLIQRDRIGRSTGEWAFRSTTMRLIAAEIQLILADGRLSDEESAERRRLAIQLVVHRLADRSREEALGADVPRTVVVETLVSTVTSILSGGLSAKS
jgi:AcrR family transcriptional regulator